MRNQRSGDLFMGLMFVLLGVVLVLKVCGVVFDIFFAGWWTLLMIIPAVVSILKNGPKTGNVLCLVIGVLLLCSARGWLPFGGKLVLPLWLVALGMILIFDNVRRK